MSRLEVSQSSYDYSSPYTGPIPTGYGANTVGWYQISTMGQPSFTVQGPTGQNPGLFAIPNHGMADDTPVVIVQLSGINNAFKVGTTYYVDTDNFTGVTPPSPFSAANTFYLSATPGGNPIVPVAPDGNGAGVMNTPNTNATHTIWMQPQRFGEEWTIERITIVNNSQIKVPSASIYRGVTSPTALIDNTANGIYNTDDLSSPIHLHPGEPVIIQFVGCDPPTTNQAIISTVYLGGQTNRR